MKRPIIKLPKIKLLVRLLLYLITCMLAVISISFKSAANGFITILYVIAGGSLFLSCCYLIQDLSRCKYTKTKLGYRASPLMKRIVNDYQYRTVVISYLSLIVNLLFALSNGFFGLIYHSVWFGTLSGYYVILGLMRFIMVVYQRRYPSKQKLAYRSCGILFIVLTLAFFISVLQMTFYGQGKSYPGMLIFAVATYTFYKIVVAVVHLGKVGKMKSILLKTIRNIGYADTLVSLVSLQTAMFVSFGQDGEVNFGQMNLITSSIVSLMILIMGIWMIGSSYIKELEP